MPRFLIPICWIIMLASGCSAVGVLFHYSPSAKIRMVQYDLQAVDTLYRFIYPDTSHNEYLRTLRSKFGIDTLTNKVQDEFECIKKILDWTHSQWKHSSSNIPVQNDPISILDESRKGKNFRCVEYGIVSAAVLNSIGIPARVIGLKTADVEKVKYGAGHVAAECYSREFRKWIFLDGQFNVIPVLNCMPLNTLEFQKAMAENRAELKLVNMKGKVSENEQENYIHWIRKYLYYLDLSFDNRIISTEQKNKVKGKLKLMLVPKNAKAPVIFQRSGKMDTYLFTNNAANFYQNPVTEKTLNPSAW